MNWGTDVSKWSRPTLVNGYEQAIRYGVVHGWSADRLPSDEATPFTPGEAYPSKDCRTLAARDTLDLAAKTFGLVS